MTIIIAAAAAVLSTVGLGWQIYSWHRTHKTRVRIELAQGLMGAPLGGTIDVICVTGNNDNDHSVCVTMWGFEANDGSGNQLVMIQPLQGSSLPGTIPAHDSATGYMDWSELLVDPRVDFRRTIVAFVQLATGERSGRSLGSCSSRRRAGELPSQLVCATDRAEAQPAGLGRPPPESTRATGTPNFPFSVPQDTA